jgi:hypothetical protein
MTSATAVLIALPSLDQYTRPWRSHSISPEYPGLPLSERVPPHITLLVPWVPAPSQRDLDRLSDTIRDFGPLDLTFPQVERFPKGVIYLRPEPFEELQQLMMAVTGAFPDYPPYGGEYPEPYPHVTLVAEGDEALLAEIRAAVADSPPPEVHIDAVTTWASPDYGLWHQTHRIPFA